MSRSFSPLVRGRSGAGVSEADTSGVIDWQILGLECYAQHIFHEADLSFARHFYKFGSEKSGGSLIGNSQLL